MDKVLTRLQNWIAANRPDYLAILAPPASDEELAKFVGVFPSLPDDLLALYRWHNGTLGANPQAFIHNFGFSSIAECLVSAVELSALVEAGEFEEPWTWDTRWIPFLESWGGNHLCVDVGGCFGGKAGQIIEYWHDDEDRNVVAPSLKAWFACFVEALEDGRFTVEGGDLGESGDFTGLLATYHKDFPIEVDTSGERDDDAPWDGHGMLASREFLAPVEMPNDSAAELIPPIVVSPKKEKAKKKMEEKSDTGTIPFGGENWAVDAKKLYCEDKGVSDITLLAKLTKLIDLALSDTKVLDLAPLGTLVELTRLGLDNAPITNISVLAKLVKNYDLRLSGTKVADLTPLAELTRLERLELKGTAVNDISPLAKLSNLTELDLRHTQTADLGPLANLKHLEHLRLEDTQIVDLAPISGLKGDVPSLVNFR